MAVRAPIEFPRHAFKGKDVLGLCSAHAICSLADMAVRAPMCVSGRRAPPLLRWDPRL